MNQLRAVADWLTLPTVAFTCGIIYILLGVAFMLVSLINPYWMPEQVKLAFAGFYSIVVPVFFVVETWIAYNPIAGSNASSNLKTQIGIYRDPISKLWVALAAGVVFIALHDDPKTKKEETKPFTLTCTPNADKTTFTCTQK